MRAGKSLFVSSADILRLNTLVQDRNAPQKHVWRAEIVLLTADGVGELKQIRKISKEVCQGPPNVETARCIATYASRQGPHRGSFRARMIAALSSPPYTKIAAIE
jgi:hypothetical protein